jgi:DNA transformation protein
MTGPRRFDDLFSEFGPIRLGRFFGGEGIWSDDVMMGMIFDDIIYFKTDEETRKTFVAEKCKPFTFVKHKSGETIMTTWFALPDRLYDDPDELGDWARKALAVATASPTARKKRKPAAPALKRRKRA